MDPRHILPDAPPDAVVAPVDDRDGVWRDVNLSAWEYDRICELLGRMPNALELELFGVMWSEHCSYKNSRALLRRLPVEGERIAQGPGENAGAIRVGDHTVVFKIESHNSPSALVPFDGAATGVGGILRDIFTMGARPVAVLDSLRFGSAGDKRQQQLLDGTTAGIADYADGMGVPNVGSEVRWDDSYRHNCLVNAMAVGVAQGALAQGVAAGPGNRVLVFGRPTGRDGVRSASFSSKSVTSAAVDEPAQQADTESDGALHVALGRVGGRGLGALKAPGAADAPRAANAPDAADAPTLAAAVDLPVVPAGDPSIGKRVMEATLALLQTDAIVGIQDMGAAGFTSSACEMAAKARTGIDIDVSLVPKVDETIQPFEVMLSETQERMLAVVAAGKEAVVEKVLREHDVVYAFCGVVTEDGFIRVRDGDDVLAAVPARLLADEAPCYVRPLAAPAHQVGADGGNNDEASDKDRDGDSVDAGGQAAAGAGSEVAQDPEPTADANWNDSLLALLNRPNIGSLSPLRARYGGEEAGIPRAAVVDLGSGPESAIAVVTYGNGRYVALDPYVGTQACVAVAARRVAATGADPVAITNGLNFGSPDNPEVYWQMERTITGMADACRGLNTPVTGGNVSLFNETDGQPIDPTPIIGMVGVLSNAQIALPQGFRRAGHAVLLLGATEPGLGGSEYADVNVRNRRADLPTVDLERERQLYDLVRKLTETRLPVAAHAVADGGLAVALAQMAFAAASGAAGCHITLEDGVDVETALFGESHGRIVVEAPIHGAGEIVGAAAAAGVPCMILGRVAGDSLRFVTADGETVVELDTADAKATWEEAGPYRWDD